MVEMDLPPRADSVAVARLVIGSLASGVAGFGEERAADLRLAVSEACTNAVQAQAEADGERRVEVRCHVAPARIEVSVRDRGRGFDPEAVRRPVDLSDPRRLDYEGGLGIPLIRLLADFAEFRNLGDGIEVFMVFGPEGPTGRIVS